MNPFVIDQSWYIKPEGILMETSAGGIVARRDAVSGKILIALVFDGRLPRPVLPKGRLEPGESPEQAARREIAEEAGLSDLTYLANLGPLERLSYSKTSWKVIHYFLYRTEQTEGQPTDPKMVHPVEWYPIDNLPRLFWPEQQWLIEQHRADIIQQFASPTA